MIYLDHAATTPLDPQVLAAMLPWMQERCANAASPHGLGRSAATAVDQARIQVAASLGCVPSSVVFTSGATEAINSVVKGVALARQGCRIIVGATEHKAVLEAADFAAAHLDAKIDVAPVTSEGEIDLDAFETSLASAPADLVVVMDTNNETGTVNPIASVVVIAREHGARILIDFSQSVGKRSVDIGATGGDYGVASAHKIGGPMGVGCMVMCGEPLIPLLHGGGQERGQRAGTTNVPGVVGFGAAAKLAVSRLDQRRAKSRELREVLLERLRARVPTVSVNGVGATSRVDDIVNVRLPGVDGDIVLARADNIALATGAACNSSVPAPSHVLLAMGIGVDHARESIRLSIGWETTLDDVERAAEAVGLAWREATELS